jgi:hypothetical protein
MSVEGTYKEMFELQAQYYADNKNNIDEMREKSA